MACMIFASLMHLCPRYFIGGLIFASRWFNTQFIDGFGQGMISPSLMGLSIKGVKNNKRASAMGFFQAVNGVGMFCGPVIVGMLSDAAGSK